MHHEADRQEEQDQGADANERLEPRDYTQAANQQEDPRPNNGHLGRRHVFRLGVPTHGIQLKKVVAGTKQVVETDDDAADEKGDFHAGCSFVCVCGVGPKMARGIEGLILLRMSPFA
jgi:hypothetical protein